MPCRDHGEPAKKMLVAQQDRNTHVEEIQHKCDTIAVMMPTTYYNFNRAKKAIDYELTRE